MGKYEKLIQKILSTTSDKNINFTDLCKLLISLDFKERIKGDRHIFTREDVKEIINIQPRGSKAKPYQVKQIRNLIIDYRLGEKDVD